MKTNKFLLLTIILTILLCIMTSCKCEHEVIVDAAVDATCTKTGLTEGSHCNLCSEILVAQEVVSAKGHIEATNESIDATCTETGLTEGTYCSVCDEILVAQEVVPANGHTEVIREGKEATCTDTGLTEGTDCSVCGEVLIAQETIPAKGHTEVIKARKEATCTDTGLTEGTDCSVCGEVLIAQETIAAKGHTEAVRAGKKATCTTTGLTDGKYCTTCNTVILEQTSISAFGHKWIAATCTSAKTCSTCKLTEGSALGHSWKAATCTSAKTCTTCKQIEGTSLGHTTQSNGVCKTCGIQLTAEDFTYLAGSDFRSIRRKYTGATAQSAYVILFTDLNGDLCVLTHVRYKIISNYSETTLHNLSTGKTISSPDAYYDKLADRAYGATRIRYMELASEVMSKEVTAMQGIVDMLSKGSHSGKGAYVDSKTLNT